MELLEPRFDVVAGGIDADRDRILELVKGAAALVADPSVPVTAELLDAAGPQLRVVANFAVGYDNVDVEACAARGVLVTNTPDVLTDATAELTLALTLAAARGIGDAERDLRCGRWRGWDPAAYRGLQLTGATFGIVGLGRIGRRYAELVGPMAGELLYASRSPKPDAERELGAVLVDLEALLSRSDVISLHVPGGPVTRGLIDARAISLMKPGAVLVNTSRGSLVDLEAVAAALREGRLGAVGLDVYEGEPEVPADLIDAPRAILLPHIGSATVIARDAMARLAAENVIAVLDERDPPTPVLPAEPAGA